MNWLVSFGAESSKLNKKLWNSLTIIILYYYQCALKNFVHSCATESLTRYVNFCVLLSVLISDFLFHSLAMNFDSFPLRFQFFTMWRTKLNAQSSQIRKFHRGKMRLNSDAQLKNSLVFNLNRFSIYRSKKQSFCFFNGKYKRMGLKAVHVVGYVYSRKGFFLFQYNYVSNHTKKHTQTPDHL